MYADLNGLKMFYEIRGTSDHGKVPVVLLHGAISATGTLFGPLPDLLAQTRQVISVEQQGHGRTAGLHPELFGGPESGLIGKGLMGKGLIGKGLRIGR